MEIPLNMILNLTEDEIKNSRLELNMTNGSGGTPFIEQWLNEKEENRVSGLTNCSYWGWYGNKRNFNIGNIVFSFVKINENEWLLISVGKILEIPPNSRAIVKILEKYKCLFGRLIINHKKGNAFARYVFRLEERIEKCTIKEILSFNYNNYIR